MRFVYGSVPAAFAVVTGSFSRGSSLLDRLLRSNDAPNFSFVGSSARDSFGQDFNDGNFLHSELDLATDSFLDL